LPDGEHADDREREGGPPLSRYCEYAEAPPSQQEFYEREWVEERRAEAREQRDVRNAGDGRYDPQCPACGCGNLECRLTDFGMDLDTGYHDGGEMYVCKACGSTGDADEIAAVGRK
jgi:hypothetical protein